MSTHTALSAHSNAQITVSDVALALGGTPVLTDVDLVVTPASRIAIVGENGRGKSTLLHVLSGALTPDDGKVRRVGTLGIAEQELSTADQRTVRQVVDDAIADALAALAELEASAFDLAQGTRGAEERYASTLERAEALDAWNAERRIRVALESLNAEPDWSRRLSELSVGQRYRVRLACLLGSDDDFLLLDEPTNHLDQEGLEFLTTSLKTRRGGIVIVSHDRILLSEIATTIIDLDPTPDGRPRTYGGGYQGYCSGRAAELHRWEQDYMQQQERRAQLEGDLAVAQARLISGWRPEKGTGKHQRATRAAGLVQNVRRRQAALDAQALTVPEPPQSLKFPELPTRLRGTLVSTEDVMVRRRLRVPISLDLEAASRTVVVGPNGSGKSTLLAVLAGELAPTSGRRYAPGSVRIGFLRQESELPLDQRAGKLFSAYLGQLVSGSVVLEEDVADLSELGLLQTRETDKRVGELSVGQRRRLDLAMVLAGRPDLLLMDEPTNHLSMSLVAELTEALSATQAAVVLSAHDRKLLKDTADWERVALP